MNLALILSGVAAVATVVYNLYSVWSKSRQDRSTSRIEGRRTSFDEAISIINELRKDKADQAAEIRDLQERIKRLEVINRKMVAALAAAYRQPKELIELQFDVNGDDTGKGGIQTKPTP